MTPVTRPPDDTVALAELLVHVPPLTPSDRFTVWPVHSTTGEGVIAAGDRFTVIALTAEQPAELV